MRPLWNVWITAALGAVVFISPAAAATWQRLDGCRLIEHESNDGDSFRVHHKGREHLFRLLYVDTPERKEMKLTERTTEQARYFKIFKRDLYRVAAEATEFSAARLKRPFTVWTQWEDAQGRSAVPRHYAVVITGEGTDLAADLVAAGLARIHGRPVSSPDGRSGAEIVADLAALEKRARENKRGAWAWVNPAKK